MQFFRSNRRGFVFSTVLAGISLQIATPEAFAANLPPKLYYTTLNSFADGRVYSSNLDGTGEQLLYSTGAGSLTTGIVADAVNGKLYFADLGPLSNSRIYSMNLDGSAPTLIATLASDAVFNIDLDTSSNTLYLARGTGISKIKTNGTGLAPLTGAAGTTSTEALTLNPVTQQLFYQNLNNSYGMIQVAAAGGIPTSILTSGYTPAFEADPATGQIYYGRNNANGTLNAISRVNPDGSSAVLIDQIASAQGTIYGLQLSPILGESNRLYYSTTDGDFGYVDLSNPSVEHELFDNNRFMYQIAVVPEPAMLGVVSCAAFLLSRRKRR